MGERYIPVYVMHLFGGRGYIYLEGGILFIWSKGIYVLEEVVYLFGGCGIIYLEGGSVLLTCHLDEIFIPCDT